MNKIEIVSWEERDVPGTLLRLPYPCDIIEVEGKLRESSADRFGIIPPYNGADPSFTTRCASVARDKLAQFGPIVVPVAQSQRVGLESFIKALQSEGFNNFAVPFRLGNSQQYTFEQLYQYMKNAVVPGAWFHVAGGEPTLPEAAQRAMWSWSEEGL